MTGQQAFAAPPYVPAAPPVPVPVPVQLLRHQPTRPSPPAHVVNHLAAPQHPARAAHLTGGRTLRLSPKRATTASAPPNQRPVAHTSPIAPIGHLDRSNARPRPRATAADMKSLALSTQPRLHRPNELPSHADARPTIGCAHPPTP
jgi:hypothetical protein